MTDLSSFFKTDLVDDHVADDVNKLIAATLRAEYANTETISATKELSDNDCQFQLITASGADRTVELAPESTSNHVTIVQNAGASNNVVVKDDSGAVTFITLAPTEWSMFIPLGGTRWKVFESRGLPAGYLFGLTLANNGSDATNDIDIATGKCRDSTDLVDMILAAALTKRLDAAWAVGTNQGGLDTGAIANATYHVWLIKRSDTGVVDALFSTSVTAPTMPTNYDYKRRIGSIVRTAAAIKAFVQDGDLFTWLTPVGDVNVTNPGTSAVTRTLTMPTGIRLLARINVLMGGHTTGSPKLYVSDLSQVDSAPGVGVTSLIQPTANTYTAGFFEITTNTSAQVRTRFSVSDAGTALEIDTLGWVDRRARV